MVGIGLSRVGQDLFVQGMCYFFLYNCSSISA
jgi:hypothetical protein